MAKINVVNTAILGCSSCLTPVIPYSFCEGLFSMKYIPHVKMCRHLWKLETDNFWSFLLHIHYFVIHLLQLLNCIFKLLTSVFFKLLTMAMVAQC